MELALKAQSTILLILNFGIESGNDGKNYGRTEAEVFKLDTLTVGLNNMEGACDETKVKHRILEKGRKQIKILPTA